MTVRATFRATIRQFLLRVYPFGRFYARPGCLQLVCGIALTSLLAAAPARADSIVFSNLGPGGTYDPGVGYNVSGPTSQAEEATAIGQPFVPLANYTFDAVDIALNWVLDTNAGTVSLASDASGQPGAVLESFTFTDRPEFSSTATDLAVGISTVHPLLRAGTLYWIVASADGDAYMSWDLNNTGRVGTAIRINDATWTPRPELASAAFRVRGSAAENVVPEPGSLLLLVTGAALAVCRRRRQTFATMLGLVIGVSYATRASADQFTLYSNTQDTQTATGFGGTNNSVLIDDVLVPSSRNPSMRPLAITSVSVFVSGLPGDEDVLSLWNYPVERDGAPGFARALIDTASVTLPSPFPFAVVTFGSGSTPLFTVSPDYSIEPGFGLFFLGLGSSRVANWQWADGPDVNRPTAYNHRLNVDRIFLNTSPGPPFPSHVSYFLEIEGSPVPEPSTLTQIVACLLLGSVLISVAPCARLALTRAPARRSA